MRELIDVIPEAAPLAAEPGGSSSSSQASNDHNNINSNSNSNAFDTNMFIILAALLCALIFALGLNSIVRCALRCGGRLARGNPGNTSTIPVSATVSTSSTGLKKRALKKIPVEVYGPEAGIPATDCPICLGEFADGEKVRVLPRCNHGFHVRCIDTWLASHSSCPTCRNSLLEQLPRS